MRERTLRIAVRVGLRPTSVMRSREPGIAAAATSQNAAEEISPGTAKSHDSGICPPGREMLLPLIRVETRKAASIRSVWSRVAEGWTTTVVPSEKSPARSTALFTCAEATGIS